MRPLFFIHGMATPWGIWEQFVKFFANKGFPCFAPRLPFHDTLQLSQEELRQLGILGIQDYLKFLQEKLESFTALSDEKPVVIGWSMGGLLAQMLAERNPIAGAILLAPAAPAGIRSLHPSVIRSFRTSLCRWGFWRKPGRQILGEWIYSMTSRHSGIIRDDLEKEYPNLSWEAGRAASEIGFDFWPFPGRHTTRVDFRNMRSPFLLVAGTEDRLTPFSSIAKLAHHLHDAGTPVEFLPWHGRGHLLYGEPDWQDALGKIFLNFISARTSVVRKPFLGN
jgi:non-heme chloroperoxidase